MRPDEYEYAVAQYLKDLGYAVEVTSYSNDYGVDIFATKGDERIAVQAKMYGGTSRRVNRQMIMELHGAKDYFDCTSAIVATDGDILPDAEEVAIKLGIAIFRINSSGKNAIVPSSLSQTKSFEALWQQYVIPLQGQTLYRKNGKTNAIVRVDWSGVERITSNGNKQVIEIEIFRRAVHRLYEYGSITREQINQEYPKRASSGIVLILSQIPLFETTRNPIGLRMRTDVQ
jgi:restriction system protein